MHLFCNLFETLRFLWTWQRGSWSIPPEPQNPKTPEVTCPEVFGFTRRAQAWPPVNVSPVPKPLFLWFSCSGGSTLEVPLLGFNLKDFMRTIKHMEESHEHTLPLRASTPMKGCPIFLELEFGSLQSFTSNELVAAPENARGPFEPLEMLKRTMRKENMASTLKVHIASCFPGSGGRSRIFVASCGCFFFRGTSQMLRLQCP